MTDTLVERVAQSLWHAAPSNLAGSFRMWNEASDQDKAAFRLMAQAALKTQASRIAELEWAMAYTESVLTAVSSAGVGEAMDRIRKALSHSSETDND